MTPTTNPQRPACVTRYHIVCTPLGPCARAYRHFPGVVTQGTHQNQLATRQKRRTGIDRGLG